MSLRSPILPCLLAPLLLAGCGRVVDLNQIMLNPDQHITLTPADFGYDFQEISVPVAEGRSVTIWYVPAPQPKAVVVVIPGAADNKSLYAQLALPIIGNEGYDIILMDYEGFGNSPGTATLQNTVDDALAVTAYAMTRQQKVALYGISLGSPLAARAAAECDVAAVVMDGNLITADALNLYADTLGGWQKGVLEFVGPMILADQMPAGYDVLRYVAQAHGAKLIIHSLEDTLTPFASALEVYQAASPPKTFWQEYGDHGRMVRIEPNVYADTLLTWLNEVLSGQP